MYWRQTVAIFLLSERVVNNIEQPEEMGPSSTNVRQHQFPPYGKVDAAVTIEALEEGDGRDERRKQRAWEEKSETLFITQLFCL